MFWFVVRRYRNCISKVHGVLEPEPWTQQIPFARRVFTDAGRNSTAPTSSDLNCTGPVLKVWSWTRREVGGPAAHATAIDSIDYERSTMRVCAASARLVLGDPVTGRMWMSDDGHQPPGVLECWLSAPVAFEAFLSSSRI